MDLSRFRECAAAYGAQRRRWPPGVHALYDCHADSAEGMAILAEAERTDAFLDAWQVEEPRDALAQEIASRAVGMPRPRRSLWWAGAAFAASAVLGFALGFGQVHDDVPTDLVQLMLGPSGFQGLVL